MRILIGCSIHRMLRGKPPIVRFPRRRSQYKRRYEGVMLESGRVVARVRQVG